VLEAYNCFKILQTSLCAATEERDRGEGVEGGGGGQWHVPAVRTLSQQTHHIATCISIWTSVALLPFVYSVVTTNCTPSCRMSHDSNNSHVTVQRERVLDCMWVNTNGQW